MPFKIHPASNDVQNWGQTLAQAIKKPVTENPLSRLCAAEQLLISLPIPLIISEGKWERKGEIMRVSRVFSVFQLGWQT